MPCLVLLSGDIEGCYRYVGPRPAYITVSLLCMCMSALQNVVAAVHVPLLQIGANSNVNKKRSKG